MWSLDTRRQTQFLRKIYNAVQYGLNPETGEINYEQVED